MGLEWSDGGKGWLEMGHLLAVGNNAAVNVCAQVFA